MRVSEERPANAPAGLSEEGPDGPAVELSNVTRRFGGVCALNGVDLSVRRGEFISLLGPSGCGKTTLLRLIAGLDLPDAGKISLYGKDANGVPAHKRHVNTVFQSYALFPHLNVRENVAFGLRMKKVPADAIKQRVAHVMETVQISGLDDRKPSELSGGQKQRVALARAIVNEPAVLLLDEPLGALDLKLRRQLQVELCSLQRRLGITFIYVTHDQEEALVMSDRIGVMNAGRIEQLGPAREVYERPRTRFVAQFLGACNLLDGIVNEASEQCVRATTALGPFRAERAGTMREFRIGEPCTFAIRPEKLCLTPISEIREQGIRARVSDIVYTGAETQYRLETSGRALSACALNVSIAADRIRIGQEVGVQFPSEALVLLED